MCYYHYYYYYYLPTLMQYIYNYIHPKETIFSEFIILRLFVVTICGTFKGISLN